MVSHNYSMCQQIQTAGNKISVLTIEWIDLYSETFVKRNLNRTRYARWQEGRYNSVIISKEGAQTNKCNFLFIKECELYNHI